MSISYAEQPMNGTDQSGVAVRAVVFDFDGVLRHWDHVETFAIEERFGLPRGSIHTYAFDAGLNQSVITGQISDDEWRDTVANRLAQHHGDDMRDAALEWRARIGVLDPTMVDLVRTIRSQITVALLTNATSRLTSDLVRHGLVDDFDYVFNSSEIGLSKPDQQIFDFVAATLGLRNDEWLFIDDTEENVVKASSLGIRSHLYSNQVELESWLKSHSNLSLARRS
jgi:putative hydrolase of the HAD superfamily